MRIFTLAAFALFFNMGSAYADCTSPAAREGTMDYFTADKVFKYCNGTTWLPMAGGGTSGTAQSGIGTGKPNAIVCRVSGDGDDTIFYLAQKRTGNILAYRHISGDPIVIEFKNDATGTFDDTTENTNCDNRSLTWLHGQGRAFYFVSNP